MKNLYLVVILAGSLYQGSSQSVSPMATSRSFGRGVIVCTYVFLLIVYVVAVVLIDKDDIVSDTDMSDCYQRDISTGHIRRPSGFLALGTTMCLLTTLAFDKYNIEARRRYPGVLIKFLGVGILLLGMAASLGILVEFKQLSHTDEDGQDDADWKLVCKLQGSVVQFSLVVMVGYSTWISCVFFNLITHRLHGTRYFRHFAEESHFWLRASLHALIFLTAAISVLLAWLYGDFGPGSGLTACWLKDFDHQFQYFFPVMMIVLYPGICLSLWSTLQLFRFLSSSDFSWDADVNQQLLRSAWGHVAWTISVVGMGTVPVYCLWIHTFTSCWIVNLSYSSVGILFIVDFHLVPRVARLLSHSSLGPASEINGRYEVAAKESLSAASYLDLSIRSMTTSSGDNSSGMISRATPEATLEDQVSTEGNLAENMHGYAHPKEGETQERGGPLLQFQSARDPLLEPLLEGSELTPGDEKDHF